MQNNIDTFALFEELNEKYSAITHDNWQWYKIIIALYLESMMKSMFEVDISYKEHKDWCH